MISRLDSSQLDFSEKLASLLAFEATEDEAIDSAVAQILHDVKKYGDSAVLATSNRFDRLGASSIAQLEITQAEMQAALISLSPERRNALEAAAQRVRSIWHHP